MEPIKNMAAIVMLNFIPSLSNGDRAVVLLQMFLLARREDVGRQLRCPEVQDGSCIHQLVPVQTEVFFALIKEGLLFQQAAMFGSNIYGSASKSLEILKRTC